MLSIPSIDASVKTEKANADESSIYNNLYASFMCSLMEGHVPRFASSDMDYPSDKICVDRADALAKIMVQKVKDYAADSA